MKTFELLVSSLNITEDEYSYKGAFILGSGEKTMNVDISDLEDSAKLNGIKSFFHLDEAPEEIRKTLMDLIMEKAYISSKFNEGENYGEDLKRKKSEKSARSLDMA
jgi:hypothetical protein